MQNEIKDSPKTKKSRKQLVIYLIIIVAMLYFIIFDNYGLIKRFSIQKENEQKRTDILNEIKVKDSLKREMHKTEFDSNEIERIAREKYGMIKQGEKVIVFEQID